jgi:hypothetical protein
MVGAEYALGCAVAGEKAVKAGQVPPSVCELVGEGSWKFSAKAYLGVQLGDYTFDDLQHCVLTRRVRKRERDEFGTAVDGYKYVILGRTVGGRPFYVCGKIRHDNDGTHFFVITAHDAD